MDLTKAQLLEKGWISIGFDGVLEYFAKENEHEEILYIPVHEGKTIGNVRSTNKSIITILSNFINKEIGNMRVCKRCQTKVEEEKEIKEYPYYCPECEENMYEFETTVKEFK